MANPELDNYVPPTPKQVLNSIVELNERYHGKFERAIQAMHEAMDDMLHDDLKDNTTEVMRRLDGEGRPKRYPLDSPYD